MAEKVEDRSNIVSQDSVRLSTGLGDANKSGAFNLYIVRPDNLEQLWEAADPNQAAQELIMQHIEDYEEVCNEDWHTWDDYEARFEANELKWIADFLLHSLVFIKSDLKISDYDKVSHVLQVLWKTLDLLTEQNEGDLQTATENRFTLLKVGVERLFTEQILNKEQVQQLLKYAKTTIFGHLQLYLTCMSIKKQQSTVKRVQIFTETPQVAEMGDLESSCKEILEQGRSATPEELMAGETAVDGEDPDGEDKNEEDEEEIVDPNDPLYGLE